MKKLLSMLIAVIMVLSMFPAMIFTTSADDAAADYAAMIGDTGYVTLKAAIAAANEGDTVVLQKDITPESEGTADVTVGKTITIDMNGYDIIGNDSYDAIYVTGGTLSLINNSDTLSSVKSGAYDGTHYGHNGIYTYGNLYISGNVDVSGAQRGIYCCNTATSVVLKNGAYVHAHGINPADSTNNFGIVKEDGQGSKPVSIIVEDATVIGRSRGIEITKADSSVSVSGTKSNVASIKLGGDNSTGVVSGSQNKIGPVNLSAPNCTFSVTGSQNTISAISVRKVGGSVSVSGSHDISSVNFTDAASGGKLELDADAKDTKYTYIDPIVDYIVTHEDGSKTITFDFPAEKVVLNDEVEYDSFAEAYANATTGDTIKIVSKTAALPCLDKTGITIIGVETDGVKPQVTFSDTTSFSATDLTIKNVSFNSGRGSISPSNKSKNITFEDCDFHCPIAAMGQNYTFKNCVFDGENGIYSSVVTGYMILDGCVFETDSYGFHNTPVDGVGSKTCDLTVKNCRIATWCALGKANNTTFEGCTFYESGHASWYYAVNLYDDAVVNNCTFEEGYFLNLSGTDSVVEVNNCEFINGNSLEHVTDNYGNNTFVVNGVKDETGKYIGGTVIGDEERTSVIIADGYEKDENGEIVVHVEAELNGVKYETFAEAYALAKSGDTIYILAKTAELPFLDKDGITIEGVPQDGVNPEIKIAEKQLEWMSFTKANDLTIKNVIFGLGTTEMTPNYTCTNLTFEGCEFRCRLKGRGSNYTLKDCVFVGTHGFYDSAVTGYLIFDGCTFETKQYGIHNSPDPGKHCDVTIENCNIASWSALGELNDVTLDGCHFYESGISAFGDRYYALALYTDAVVKNCTFEGNTYLATGSSDCVIELNDCDFINGATLEHVTYDVGDNVFVIDGVKDEDGKYISGTVVGKEEKTSAVIAEGYEKDENGVIVTAPLPDPCVNFTNISFTVGNTMSANVSIEDGINGYAYTADKCVLYIDALVDGEWIELGSDTVVPATDAIVNGDTVEMKFSVSGIPMAYLADNMRIRLYAYGNETYYVEVTEFDEDVALSFVSYTAKAKELNSENASLAALLNAMLNYTAAVQQYKGHNTENLANAGLTEDEKAVPSIVGMDFSEYADALIRGVSSKADAKVNFNGSQLLMNSDKTGFQFYFTVQDGVNVSALELQVKYNGKTVTIPASTFKSRGEGQYSAIFEGLDPTEFDAQITAAVFEGENRVSNVAYDSIPATAKLVSENPRYANMVEIYSGMLAYCKAAKAYISNPGEPEEETETVSSVEDLKTAFTEGAEKVVLAEDIEITSQTPGLGSDNVTIDLNGNTLTASGTLAIKKEVRTYMTQEYYDQLVEKYGVEEVEKAYGTAENCVGKRLLNIEYLPVEAKIENGTYVVKNNGGGRIRFETGSTCVFENVTFKSDSTTLQQALQVYVKDATVENTYVFRNCTFENTYVEFCNSSGVPANFNVSFENCSFYAEKPTNGSGLIKFTHHTTGKLSVSDCSFNIKAGGALKSYAIYHQGASGNNKGTLIEVTLNNVTFVGEKTNASYLPGYYYVSKCVGEGNTGVFSVTETGTNSYVMNYGDETITTDCWGNDLEAADN